MLIIVLLRQDTDKTDTHEESDVSEKAQFNTYFFFLLTKKILFYRPLVMNHRSMIKVWHKEFIFSSLKHTST